jgi:uncharacterized protein YacL
MKKEYILYSSFLVIIVVAILNHFGGQFYWYWTHRWFDIPVHMLGGLSVGFAALWFWAHFMHLKVIRFLKLKALGVVILAIFFVGISWEIFELLGGITNMTDRGYWPDTIGDIINDFIGAIFAYFIFMKTKKPEKEAVVIKLGNNIN